MQDQLPEFLILGQLRRDFILFPDEPPLLDVPGGNALYASVGLAVWQPNPPPAIIARVGEDFPREWLEQLSNQGINTRGVTYVPQEIDLRFFSAFMDRRHQIHDDPVTHFARLGIPFPKALLGYLPEKEDVDSRTQFRAISLRQGDIPQEFLLAHSAHLCPLDFLSHNFMPTFLRQAGFTLITLDPSPGYMNPTFWDDMPMLLTGVTAFLPAEEEVRALFHTRTTDLWEMAEGIAAWGCEVVVIKCGESGQLVYEVPSRKRWEIPSYPSRLRNPIGAGDAFCGGFLAGYRRTYDPLEAALQGNISASIVVEGHRATYALDVLPGLPQARLEVLRQSVRRV